MYRWELEKERAARNWEEREEVGGEEREAKQEDKAVDEGERRCLSVRSFDFYFSYYLDKK